jgi:hypothetical protein
MSCARLHMGGVRQVCSTQRRGVPATSTLSGLQCGLPRSLAIYHLFPSSVSIRKRSLRTAPLGAMLASPGAVA